MPQTVLVTGANGLVGKGVVPFLLSKGYVVHALMRNPAAPGLTDHPQLRKMKGDMKDVESLKQAMQHVDWVAHLAAAKNDEVDSEEANVQGAKNLVEACKQANVRCIVNLSTQSVKLTHKGTYGRTKAAADEVFRASSIPTVTLLSSVIYATKTDGIFGSILGFSKLPVIPVIGSGTATFMPIHHDDLAAIIERCAQTPAIYGKTFDAGGPDEISFNQLVKEILQREHKHRLLFHISIPVAMLMAKVFAILPKPPITRSNVLGAEEQIHMRPQELWTATGIMPRSLKDGLDALFPAINRTTIEAKALLKYVLRGNHSWQPDQSTVELYQRALQIHAIDPQHVLDAAVLKKQWLLGSLDAMSKLRYPSCTLQRKLLIAAAITECSPASATWLLPKDTSWINLGLKVIVTTLISMMYLCIGVLLLLHPSFFKRNAGL